MNCFFCLDGVVKDKTVSEENKTTNGKVNGNNIHEVEKKVDEIEEFPQFYN